MFSTSVIRSSNLLKSSSRLYTTASTATASSSPSLSSKSIYDLLRRKRDRSGLINIQAEQDSEVTTFPRERSGLDYELNWTLNGYSITPYNQAYRNPREKLLLQNSVGTKDKNNVLTVVNSESANTTNYYLDESVSQLNSNSSTISIPNYKAILELVKDNISEGDNIYVRDAAVGSDKGKESTIRAVTNDSVSALFLNHLLPNTNVGSTKNFKHSLTVYLTPKFVLSNPEKYGLKSSSFNIIDVKRGIAVISGNQSTENIRNVISAISSNTLMKTYQDTLPLPTSTIYSANEKTVLAFDSENYLLNNKFSGKVVSQGSIWSVDSGLTRLFDSITYSQSDLAVNQCDLVEKVGKKVNATIPIKFTTNVYQQPNAVVFFVNDKVLPSFAQLNVDQAEKYFVTGFTGENNFYPFYSFNTQSTTPAQDKAALFKKLISVGTNVYIINTNSLKPADVDKLLTAMVNGKVNKASQSDVFTTLSPISSSKSTYTEQVKSSIKEFETKLEKNFEKLTKL
ncbi:hypothetical protein CYY_004360 [Polysphondylium violaceum]|uniref:phosphoenolpyruvate carboxykinase (ATP) n=1 Tax=Polysphondylium violaceum TaxID=133409 RepID=A0A8J4V7U8_9MYCE|nr:hypothetical protein CYY_004360 [Polysphondylium violaceum]